MQLKAFLGKQGEPKSKMKITEVLTQEYMHFVLLYAQVLVLALGAWVLYNKRVN
jgi:hypothetical protein